MKRIYLTLAVTIILSGIVSAQGLYIRAGVTKNFAAYKSNYIVTNTTSTTSSRTMEGVNVGQGVAPTLALGYMFNKHIGLELGGAYSIGSKNVLHYSRFASPATIDSTATISANMLALYPTVKLQTSLIKSVKVYSRAGLIVPVAGGTKTDVDVVATAGGNILKTVNIGVDIKGKPSVGFSGALGLSLDIIKKLSIWGEVNSQSLKVWATSSSLNKYIVNGNDSKAALPVYAIETKYYDQVTNTMNSDLNPAPDYTKAKDDLKKEATFSTIGIGIGIAYKF